MSEAAQQFAAPVGNAGATGTGLQLIMIALEGALRDVVRASALVDYEENQLRQLVNDLVRIGSVGMPEKVQEYRGGRAEDLVAELRVAWALVDRCETPPVFEVGDAPDFRFDVAGTSVLADVVHKSVSHALSTVLYPDPDRLAAYSNPAAGQEWR